MKKEMGRPKQEGEADNRDKLLKAARKLFVRHGYTHTTTRIIAEEAGLTPAMIRYYFVDKRGLFEAVLQETIAPMLDALSADVQHQPPKDLFSFISLYAQIMAPSPDLPRLIIRSLYDTHSAEHEMVSQVFSRFIDTAVGRLSQALTQQGVLRPEVDIKLALISCVSLTVFPFLIPKLLTDKLGVTPDASFFAVLAQHNQQLLSSGLVAAPKQGASDDA
ncbi:transcriptional regulator, TetR family [Oceanospirillum multiglobuliferum]|uniref:HTH tetR-type domain-containing protein n=1 Tax=Oceanospirillum multiglobuliferum TaxID=64969 RepID=A0A1T4P5P9_9GAMM|nr:TetR/AcrR family transcriptional regulator [Oceanospirillum multiglobuliferum]OPX54853.1 hypothetical protein BTE48_12110 [Oceanospirillum multiglobuliferum]SJZ86885.1 transcriptional regulator, TetR family [Oceanospirillum multiglobuliferum]